MKAKRGSRWADATFMTKIGVHQKEPVARIKLDETTSIVGPIVWDGKSASVSVKHPSWALKSLAATAMSVECTMHSNRDNY